VDKIYSRRRIRIYRIKPANKKKNIKREKIIKLFAISTIAFITVYSVLKSINPIFDGLCISKVNVLATDIINTKTSEILAKYQYEEILQVIYNEKDNTNILKTDVVTINKIISEISVEITKILDLLERENIKIYVGALTGNRYFSAMGPAIDIKVMHTGSITTDVKTEFESIGINQSVYRIYLEISCNMSILTPYKKITNESTNKVLLVETVIVGGVPETYYNLEGVTKDDTLNMMQ
jgi:sporulation protein YunB